MWTLFWDMHSGGSVKVEIDGKEKSKIYIELPEAEAIKYFEERFGHHPYEIACDCCGENYSLEERATLDEASEYHRDAWTLDGKKFKLDVEDYIQRDDVLVIYAKNILQVVKYPSLENKSKNDNDGAPGTFGYLSIRD
jgi:Holliday junction resolvase